MFSGNAPCGIQGLEDVFYYAVVAVRVIQIAAPIALIIWGSIDFLKAVIAGDEKAMQQKRKPFIQRLISAVLVFLVPWILVTVLDAITTNDANSNWKKCYNAAKK